MGEADAIADSVAGRVISSYTPTLTALTRARVQAAPGRVRQLAVGVPEAPSYAPGARLAACCPRRAPGRGPPPAHAPGRPPTCSGLHATRQAVLQRLPGHSWLATCSCQRRPATRPDASLSAFLLHDQPADPGPTLPPSPCARPTWPTCRPARPPPGDLRLPDEGAQPRRRPAARRLPSRFSPPCGVSSDAAAPGMADTAYAPPPASRPRPPRSPPTGPQGAPGPGMPCTTLSPGLRKARPGEPLLWAPYIHLGP